MRSTLSILLLTTAAAAQLPFVSPITANGVEGAGSGNGFPFTSTVVRRYQQIHGDLPQTGLMLSRLAFRVNTPTTATTYIGTRVMNLELNLGNGPNSYADVSKTLANNFTGTPTNAIALRTVNWGPVGATVSPGPQPFSPTSSMDLVLDAPYLFLPVTPTLTWEVVMHSQVGTNTFGTIDNDLGSLTTVTGSTVGTGCICTGRTAAQTASISMGDMQGYLGVAIGTTNGTPSAQVFSAIGFSNPNVPFPGLCSNIYTDFAFFFPNGTTGTTGSLANSAGFGFFLPNTFPGAQLFFQNFTLDPALPGVPLCASSGVSFTVPNSNLTKIVQASRMFDSSGTTTATEGLLFTGSTLGYALPVEFN